MKSITKRIISTLAICGALVLEAGAVAFGSLGKHSVSRVDAAEKTLTFDLTSNPGGWPTSNSTTLTDYTYTLDDVDYTFKLKNIKCNSGYLMATQPAALGLPAIENYKLTKVVAKNTGGCSTSVNVGISSSASDAFYISGGGAQKWATQSSSYTYTLSETANNTVYYMYVTSKNAQITELVLTYSGGSDPTPTSDYTVSFDLKGHGTTIDPQTISPGGKVTRPSDPSETGWTFGGWYNEEGCTTAYDFNTPVNSSFTLYAKWTQDSPTPVGDADIINFDLTKDKLNGTATSTWVADFSKTLSSGASVTIHSMGTKGTNNALQWNKNAYLYMTTSGGTLKSVTVKGASKKINIFGSTSAFSGEPTGTATGSVTGSSSGATYTFAESSEFTYLAMHGTESSTTISEITINYRVAKTLESIEVKTAPLKVDYTAGENFDPTGLEITATYDSGDPEDIAYAGNESKFAFEPSTNLTQGTTSVQITYGGKSCNQAITVGAAVTLTSIQSITGSLTATIGGSWNTSNLVVTGLMSNSTTKNITQDCNVTVNTPVPSSAGTGNASVTATYKTDGTKTLTVTNIPYTVSVEHGTTPEDPFTIDEAKAIIDGSGSVTASKTYYIKGYFQSVAYAWTDANKNMSVWVSATSSGSGKDFEFYKMSIGFDPSFAAHEEIIVSALGSAFTKFGTTYEANVCSYYNKPYSVTFNGNGADEGWENPSVSQTWNSNYFLPATNPTKTGYNFVGWFTATTGGTQITTASVAPKTSVGTLYAHWSGQTFTVTLDAKGGTGGSTSVTATYNANMPKITAPSNSGYTFNGYFDAETGGTKYYNTDGSSAHVWDKTSACTLYAQYSANTYTVTFDGQGVTVTPASKTVTYNSTYGDLPELNKTGYTFDGWYTEAEGGSKVVSTDTVLITANQTLYAHWIAKTYTVSFDSQGGSTCESKTVTYNSTYGDLPEPTKAGNAFVGWYTDAEAGTKVLSTDTVLITANQTLYAHWTDAVYRVTFVPGDGATVSPTYKDVIVGEQYGELPEPSKTGYSFDGWYTDAEGGTKVVSTDIVSITANQTLYAHWTANTYTVSFDSQGGSSCSSKTVTYNSTYGELPEPSKTGYTFDGWYTDAEGGTKVVSTDIVLITANQTLYAHWTANTYTVSFDSQGGSTCSSKTVTYNSTYGELPEPSKTGYTFAGWYTDSEGGSKIVSTDTVLITANQTLYAHWTANTYTVSFDPQGGSSCQSKTVTYNSTYGELPEPSKTGYTFAGWYTDSEGGSKIVSTDTVLITANQTLYAHWTANTYTVSFDSQGGSTCSSKTVTYNSTYGELPEPSKTGYTFAGWYTDSEGGSKVVSTDTVLITANQTLYAHWTANKYAVTFDGNDADVWTTEVIDETYGSAYVLPVNVPTKVGYHFVGWFTEEVGGTQITSSTIVNLSAAQTLYAHFEINVYSVITNAGHSTPESEVTELTHGSAYNNTFTAQEGWYIESITYTIEGSESVTVQGNALSIKSVTNNLSITVNTVQIVLDHITVSPESVEIDYDGTINKDNLVVTAFYNAGKDSARVTDFEITGYDNKTPGTYEATVSYTEDGVTKTTTLTVVVANKVVSLEVSGYDTTVDQGKDYVFNGKVVAHYQDGSTIENPEGVEVSKLDTSGHGLQTAKVSFGGVSTEITINVIQTKTPIDAVQAVAIGGGCAVGVSILAVGLYYLLKMFKL